jgi:hypothetical protein
MRPYSRGAEYLRQSLVLNFGQHRPHLWRKLLVNSCCIYKATK